MGDYEIVDGVLVRGSGFVDHVWSPNMSLDVHPKFLVLHFTATNYATPPQGALNVANYFSRPDSKVSAHFIIDIDGSIIQCVRTTNAAWHAGKSRWNGYNGLNGYSIGIEVVNPGPLKKTVDGRFVSWFGEIYSSHEYDIIVSRHHNGGPEYGWIPFTQAQTNTIIELGSFLMKELKLEEAVGHDMISPGRKLDPGPCMDYRVYDILNRYGVEKRKGKVVARVLNVREGPGLDYQVIGQLYRGDVVEIEENIGNQWYAIPYKGIVGFVSARYVNITNT